MLNALRQWWPLLLAVLAVQLANGLHATAIGMRVDTNGFSPSAIAIVLSAFYVGQVLASLAAPRLIATYGQVPVFVGCCVVFSFTMALFITAQNPLLWTIARFIIGFGIAGIFIAIESWLNDRSSNQVRGRVFAVYIFIQLAGMMIAQGFIPPLAGDLALAIAVVMIFGLLAILPVAFGGAERPDRHPFASASFRALARASPLGVAGAVVSGFVWAVVMAMSPIYALRAGFDTAGVALFVALAVLGGAVLQLPIGWLSDRGDRRIVLAASSLLAALAATGGWLAGSDAHTMVLVAITLFGGLTFPFYSLATAHVNDRVEPRQLVPASAALVLLFGVGSVFGPVAGSAAMEALGPDGFFAVLALVTAALGVYATYRLMVRSAPGAAQA